MNKQQQLNKFNQVYNKLNPQQKQAVDALSGAVMVIAGPGTGKTQILSARIGKILLETDTRPENILCLTYTDAGALAMRKRLTEFIGAEAYKVNLHTFHSFCNNVIQDNLSLFNKNSLDALSDLERIAFMRELIDGFSNDNPLKRFRGDVYYEIHALTQLFSSIKREGWKQSFLFEKIEEHIEHITTDTTNKDFYYIRKTGNNLPGTPKAALAAELEKMNKLKAAIQSFTVYQQILDKHKRYDFDDMINWVIDAFENNSLLLQIYQEQYNHILIDEYQDTSSSQNKIVSLLYNEDYTESAFVVGDDDQSIYRFQGANVENMQQFAKRYVHQLQTVVLDKNYRSTQPILNVAKNVIDNNNERLIKIIPNLSKNLSANGHNVKNLNIEPVVNICASEREEMMHITLAIQQLIQQQQVAPQHIAVLYRENKYGEALSSYLKQLNIPFYSKRQYNLFNHPLAKQVLNLLQYLAFEHDIPYGGDALLFEILHYKCFNIKAIEIAKCSVAANATKYFKEPKKPKSFREYIVDEANKPATTLFDVSTVSTQLKKAINTLEDLIAQVPNCTLLQLVPNIIYSTGIIKQILTMPAADKFFALQIITTLYEFVGSEAKRNPDITVKDFCDTIALMQKEKIALPVVQTQGNDKGVNLLTIHGSKGLEFAHVFMVGCSSNNWEKKSKPAGVLSLPPTVFENSKEVYEQNEKEAKIEELRRLFYVGVTRAETHLYFSYSAADNKGKALEPTVFLQEIIGNNFSYTANEINIATEQATDFLQLDFLEPVKPVIDAGEDDFIQPLLQKFTMNVTALNNYLRCPLEFYFNNLVRIPSGKNENTVFGSAIHFALEMLFKNMTSSDTKSFESLENCIQQFKNYMIRNREHFTPEQYKRRMAYGEKCITGYYNHYIHSFNKIVSIEKNLGNVVVSGVPIKGKVDKLEFDGSYVNVVDYKTGDYQKQLKKKAFAPPLAVDDKGGDYWRQAVFYKLLIDNYQSKEWKVISTEFDFIEPVNDSYIKEKITITPDDLQTVTDQITSTWQKIQNKEFYTGCGKEECYFCNFVKENEVK